MDAHTLECLDFYRVRELLSRHALTALGRGLALRIEPTAHRGRILQWMAQVRELADYIEQHGLPPLGGLSEVRPIVDRCGPPLRVVADDMAQVATTLAATGDVCNYLRELPPEAEQLRRLAARIGDFSTVAARIRKVVDPRGCIRDDASPRIARIRSQISTCRRRIRETVDRLLRDPAVRRLLQFANHTYVNDRLVLPLRTECRGRLPGIIHGGSGSGATLFVEPAQAVELNNEISKLRNAEREETHRLLWDLAHEVHINAEAIHKTLAALAVLDLVVAKLQMARTFAMRCPEIAEDSSLSVRGARHPLLLELVRRHTAPETLPAALPDDDSEQPVSPEAIPSEVVPIDYRLGEDFDLLIITGPNTGGKTVTLKTVGLLSLMAQAGLPVPVAPGARFGVFRRILIDIGDEQSMQQSLSTFSAHMKRQLDMLRKAGPEALILIDELGAGTDPDQGAAIGRAILDELLRVGCRGIVTTHIGALKAFPLVRERAENGCVDFDDATLEPTYRLRIGEPGTSNALQIAQRLGMPQRLIQAARKHLGGKAGALNAAIASTRQSKRQAESARADAERAQLQAAAAAEAARAARAEFERRREDFQRWMQRVVHLRPGEPVRVRNFDHDGRIVRVRLDQQRAVVDMGSFTVEVPLGDIAAPELPAPPPPPARPSPVKPVPPKPARKPGPTRLPAEGPHRASPRKRRGPPAHWQPLSDAEARALRANDRVYVRRFHREGSVVRVDQEKRLVVVSVGLLEIETPFTGLAKRTGN